MKQRRCERNTRKVWKDVKDKVRNKREKERERRNRKKVSE